MDDDELPLAGEVDDALHEVRARRPRSSGCAGTRARARAGAGSTARTPRRRSRTGPRPAPSRTCSTTAPAKTRREEVDRVARARDDGGVARLDEHPHQVGEPLLRPDRRQRLRLGVERRPRTGAGTGRRPPAAGSGSRGSTSSGGCVGLRTASRSFSTATSGEGRSGLPKPRSIDVVARAAQLELQLVDRREDVGRKAADAPELHQRTTSRSRCTASTPRGRPASSAAGHGGDPLREHGRRPGRASSTASPGSNAPSHATTPTPSRLPPSSTIARRAPASTVIRPRTGLPNRSQSLKADSLRSAAAKRVPRRLAGDDRLEHLGAGPAGDHGRDPGGGGELGGQHLAPHPAAAERARRRRAPPRRRRVPRSSSSAPGVPGARE